MVDEFEQAGIIIGYRIGRSITEKRSGEYLPACKAATKKDPVYRIIKESFFERSIPRWIESVFDQNIGKGFTKAENDPYRAATLQGSRQKQ